MKPEVRFCTSTDGVKLAYTISGGGPPIVRAQHWFTHLEHDWNNPAVRPWTEDLARRYRLLRFDQRGTGLSDREVPEISLEAHVRTSRPWSTPRGSSALPCSACRRVPRSPSPIRHATP